MQAIRSPRIAFLFFLLVHIALFFTMRLLPFVDLPSHLAEATIFKYHDTNPLIGAYYQPVPGYYPNTFHTVFCSLFSTVELGNRVFFALYIALLLGSVFLVVKELKGNLWYGLLCVMFIFGYNTTYGFVGYAIAIPTLVLLFYVALLDVRKPNFGYTFAASLLMVLLYLMHAQVALFGLLLYGAMILYAFWRKPLLMIGKGILVVVPMVLMMVLWWMNRTAVQAEGSTIDYLINYYSHIYLPEFKERIKFMMYDHWSLTGRSLPAIAINALILLPLLLLGAWKHIPRRFFKEPQFFYPILFLVLTFGCYIFLPDELPGQAPLFERFSTILFLSIIILGSVALRDVKARWLPAYTVALCMAYSALWGEYLYSFNKENKMFNASFFKDVKQDQILSGLMYGYQFRKREVYIHYPNYNMVWNQGLTTSKIIDFRFGVVRRTEKGAAIPNYYEWVGYAYKTAPAKYQDSLQYLLQHEESPVNPDENTSTYKLLKQEGKWKIYANTKNRMAELTTAVGPAK